MKLIYNVDDRAIKYYVNRSNQMEYLKGNTPQAIDKEVLKRKWNAMVKSAFDTGMGVYKKKDVDNEYKVFVGNFKFTVNTETNTIRYVDHESFINMSGKSDFNPKKMCFNLQLADTLKNTYKQFGLNNLGNRIVIS